MNDTKTTPHAFSLPDEHPAKPFEEMLRAAAPHLAAGLYEWLRPRPRRPPLATRATLAVADRLTRAGRALRAFVRAYDEDATDVLFSRPSIDELIENAAAAPPPAPAPTVTSAPPPHANGIARPPAAEGTST